MHTLCAVYTNGHNTRQLNFYCRCRDREHFLSVQFNIRMDFIRNPPDKISKFLTSIHKWTFNVFPLAHITNFHSLEVIAYHLFDLYHIPATFNIPPDKLIKFLIKVNEGYYMTNPYHNSIHASDTVQTLHYFLWTANLKSCLTALECFAVLLAAIMHDFKHTGTSNRFHIVTRSKLATLYNDRSVLENYHAASLFQLLQNDDYNIVSNLTTGEYRRFRSLIINMILSTDMKKHDQILDATKRWLVFGQSSDPVAIILPMLLHCCDISNGGKPWPVHRTWTTMLYKEFLRQHIREKKLGVARPCWDRMDKIVAKEQLSFLTDFMAPTFDVCARMIEYCLENVDRILEIGRADSRPTVSFVMEKPWVECLAENMDNWAKMAADGHKGTDETGSSVELDFLPWE